MSFRINCPQPSKRHYSTDIASQTYFILCVNTIFWMLIFFFDEDKPIILKQYVLQLNLVMFYVRSDTKLTKCTIINWNYYFIIALILLKYNETITHYGSSGSESSFNQILANARGYLKYCIYDLCSVKVVVDKFWVKLKLFSEFLCAIFTASLWIIHVSHRNAANNKMLKVKCFLFVEMFSFNFLHWFYL